MQVEPEPAHAFRRLAAGQSAQLWVLDLATGNSSLLLSSRSQLFEAPNWHPSGAWIVVNADGRLYRIATDGPANLGPVPSDNLPELNNDHLVSPDGDWHYISGNDGHIWRLPWDGGRCERVTADKTTSRQFRRFLHGVSADGTLLAFVGTETLLGDPGGRRALWILDLRTGAEEPVDSGFSPADGPEFSPDALSLYFNSEFRSIKPGHAQIFRKSMTADDVEQLTFDGRVNWFPHASPDGCYVSYLSFLAGTLGHPADLPVSIRLLDVGNGGMRVLANIDGGQGTLNVNSWAPDSNRLAYVAYPFDTS